jgi:acyl-coenzyme A synthetase/AMP-(fatty) acid ligase
MPALPLITHAPDAIVAWRAGRPVSARRFLGEVRELAARLPAGSHLLNLCADRYRFSVGLAAAIVAGKISLLPPANTPQLIRQIRDLAPDVFCLTDSAQCTVDLPLLRYPDIEIPEREDDVAMPQIDCRQRIAILFTSGSTGTPQPHAKTWGPLIGSVRAAAERLGLRREAPCTLLGTVPPQHMYGLESTVLMAWQSGSALSDAQPFYPLDIAAALAAVAAPRLLISTPIHLRALREAGLDLPELAGVVSATAPLSTRLAQDIEARFNSPLTEIYGSTETGVIATRRTAQDERWQLLPAVELLAEGDRLRAVGANIETSSPLNDRIESCGDGQFLLHGRLADLINIAGKRHSLASLNHLLNGLPGVVDGVFYLPDQADAADPDRTARLAACVVAPGMTARQLLAALREAIDPAFLPRPLLFVDRLPRNSSGKLPQAQLHALFARRGAVESPND